MRNGFVVLLAVMLAALPAWSGLAAEPNETIAGLGPDGQTVVIATDGGAIVIRDVTSGAELARELVPITRWLSVVIGKGAATFAGVGVDAEGSVKLVLWPDRSETPKVMDAPFNLDEHTTSFVETPQIAPDGRFVIFRRDDDEPGYLIDLASGKMLAGLGSTSAFPYSPDGSHLAHFNEDDGTVAVLRLDGMKAETIRGRGNKIGQASYLPDGRLAIVGLHDCEILHVPAGGNLSPTRVSPPRARCYARDISADGRFLIASEGMEQAVILKLADGTLVWSRPESEADQVQTEAGVVIRERNDRPYIAPLSGGSEQSLEPDRTFLRNSYRSVVLAGGRYLNGFYEEAVQVFDLQTGAEIACFDAADSCEATRIRRRYGHALAKGQPSEVVAVLTGAGNVKAALGDKWGQSRLELARAHLELGNRAAARGAYGQAMDSPDLAIRAGAQIGLARQLLQEGEPARAKALLEDVAETLMTVGPSSTSSGVVLVRASNGAQVSLSPADLTHYAQLIASLEPAQTRTFSNGSRIELSEGDFAKISDIVALNTRAIRSAGFPDGLRITKHRYALLALLGEAQALRAQLALQLNGQARANERGAAALDLLNVNAVLFDGDESNLSLAVRIERQLLRGIALRQFVDGPGPEILGPLRSALALLEKSQPVNPQTAARLRVALADAQTLIGAARDAEGNLARAEEDLRRALPANHPDLLHVTGKSALATSRRGETGPGLAKIESAIELARTASVLTASQVTDLTPLFSAGVEVLWLAGQERPTTVAVAQAGTRSPLFVSIRPDGDIRHLAFSPDGKRLTSREGLRLIDWDLSSGQSLSVQQITSDQGPQRFDRDKPILFDDGQRIAQLGETADTILISGPGMAAPIDIRFSSVIGAMAVSPDGDMIAVGDTFSAALAVYQTATGVLIGQLDGHSDPIRSLAWSPDSAWLASGSDAGAILVHDPQAGFVVTQLGARVGDAAHRGEIEDFAFSPDGTALYTVANAVFEGDRPPLWQWDTSTRRLTARYPTGRDDLVVVGSDGARIATLDASGIDLFNAQLPAQREIGVEDRTRAAASYQQTLTFAAQIDAERLLLSSKFGKDGTRSILLSDGSVQWSNAAVSGDLIAIDPAGERVALLNTLHEKLFIVSLIDGAEICSGKLPYLDSSPSLFNGRLAFSPNGTTVTGIGRNLTEEAEPAPLANGIGRTVQWHAADCSVASDKGGAAAQADRDALTLAWRGDMVAVAEALPDPADPAVEIGFSPDGTRAWAITAQNTVWLWFVEPERAPVQLAQFAPEIGKILFSPDGARLAVSSETGLWLWNAKTGALEGELGQ